MSNKETKVKEEVKKEGEFKIKSAKKVKDLSKQTPDIIKIDLTKKPKDAIQTQEADDSDAIIKEQKDSGDSESVVKEIRTTEEKVENESDSPIQEIKDEDNYTDKSGVAGSNEATTTVSEQKEIPKEVEAQKLPENIDKLIKFMKDTGGDVNDYARLNAD